MIRARTADLKVSLCVNGLASEQGVIDVLNVLAGLIQLTSISRLWKAK